MEACEFVFLLAWVTLAPEMTIIVMPVHEVPTVMIHKQSSVRFVRLDQLVTWPFGNVFCVLLVSIKNFQVNIHVNNAFRDTMEKAPIVFSTMSIQTHYTATS
jgi:hypothetical protein